MNYLNIQQETSDMLNKVLHGESPPENLQKAILISLFKKVDIKAITTTKSLVFSILDSKYTPNF